MQHYKAPLTKVHQSRSESENESHAQPLEEAVLQPRAEDDEEEGEGSGDGCHGDEDGEEDHVALVIDLGHTVNRHLADIV